MSPLPALILATSNPGKVSELAELLEGRYSILARPAELAETIEDQDTLEKNALKKACEVADFSGELALSDDSGLFVDALGGAPGVHTARFAGAQCSPDDNMDKLLVELAEVPPDLRSARFRTVIVVAQPPGDYSVAVGEVEGHITQTKRGADGFGYDPIFEPNESGGLTFAEMPSAQKRALSHRAKALALMLSQLES